MNERIKVNCEICGSFLHTTEQHIDNREYQMWLKRKKVKGIK